MSGYTHVAPAYDKGNRIANHIRNVTYIVQFGKNTEPKKKRWSPPEEAPGQAFAREITTNPEYADTQVVYWPKGRERDTITRRMLRGKVIKEVEPKTSIDYLVDSLRFA